MGIFRPSRRRSEDGPETLGQRMTIFIIGAIVGIAGIASGTSWIIYIAVGILAIGILLRVAHGRR